MKKTILLLVIGFIIFSCNGDVKKVLTPKAGQTDNIAALYRSPKGGAVLDAMLRVINKVVGYDSVEREDFIKYDTLWGYPQLIPIRDSTGKQVLDSLGNQQIRKIFFQIQKDSVYWRIENKNLDSLVKELKW